MSLVRIHTGNLHYKHMHNNDDDADIETLIRILFTTKTGLQEFTNLLKKRSANALESSIRRSIAIMNPDIE